MMATSTDSRRKSQRRSVATKKKSYKEAFVSEDEEDSIEAKLSKYLGDGESSGSDFEAELKKNSGSKKYEEEEDEDDESDAATETVVEEKKKKAPSRWKKTKSSNEKVKSITSIRDLSLSSKLAAIRKVIVPEKEEPSKKSCKDPQVKLRQFKSKMDPNSQLNLSESSDSEADSTGKKGAFSLDKPINHVLSSQSLSESSDGEGESAPKTVVSKPTSNIPSKHSKFAKREIKEEEEDDDSEMASQLVNLVKSQTEISDFVENCANLASTLKSTVKIEKTETVANIEKSKTRKSEKSTSVKSEKIKKGQSSKKKMEGGNDSADIHDLLALGEGISVSLDSGDESEDETDPKKVQSLASGSIEIAIEVPGKEKKKGKGFDVEAYLKRELAKVQREVALAVHQTHILCLIAHLRYLNSFTTMNVRAGDVSAKTTLSVALSAIPQLYCVNGKDLTLTSLAMFVRWFHDNFRVSFGIRKDQFPSPLDEWIQHAYDMFKCESYEHLVIAFLCACRSLGWKARLVLHLEASSLKPKKESDDDQKIKEATTASSAKRKSSDAVTEHASKKVKRDLESRVSLKATTEKCSKSHKKNQSPSTKPSSSKDRKCSSSPGGKDKLKPKNSKEKSDGIKHKNEKVERSRPKRDQLAPKIIEKTTKTSKKGFQLSDKALKEASKRRSINGDRSSSEEDERPKEQKKVSTKLSSKKQGRGKTETQSQRSPVKTRRSSVGKVKPGTKISYAQTSSDDDEEEKPKQDHRKSISSKGASKSKLPTESSDEFEIAAPVEKKVKRNIVQPPGKTVTYWIEVLTKSNGWVTVDMVRGRTNCTDDMEAVLIKPVLYIVACNASGSIKDVTKKYVNPSTYLTTTRKSRVSQEWLDGIFNPFQPNSTPEDTLENEKMEKHLMSAPLPTTVGAFKGHPLYVLTRHLLKFEGIYPENPPPLGFIHGEPVFARECVHTLHCRVTWLKEGRVVKIGEEPYKIVKARPKWDRMSGTVTKDMPLEVFGKWQTQLYVAPPAKDGKVPRNEYGNVDFFKPWMLPKGTVHLPITGLNRVAKKLNIDCPQAMTGWEFSGGGCHPVFDGFIVCEEVAETLMDAWNAEVEEKQRKDAEKKEKRVLDNWKKLVKGLLMHQKIRKKYLGKDH